MLKVLQQAFTRQKALIGVAPIARAQIRRSIACFPLITALCAGADIDGQIIELVIQRREAAGLPVEERLAVEAGAQRIQDRLVIGLFPFCLNRLMGSDPGESRC
ncbi:hypothetical protein C1X15_17115 [Pseudomonas sp. GW123-5D08]|nr:hypothetical protein C1X22_06855 [Pseudomonas sp. DP16D-L5]PMV45922.1 hypothetical protein C1X16_12215 [Pseudomonas sp. FW305-3-2-15-C-R2A1]PMV73359.1 hypothetical protein C1X15_17115 [Pseudomonas sp. GW123-5D08]